MPVFAIAAATCIQPSVQPLEGICNCTLGTLHSPGLYSEDAETMWALRNIHCKARHRPNELKGEKKEKKIHVQV